MRSWAKRYLKYSDSTSRVVAPFDHRLDTQAVRDDRERNQRDIGKLVRDLGARPRHVVGGGDDDERMKIAIHGPAACTHGVAQRVDRRIVEVDAAGQQAVVAGDLPRNIGRRRSGVDAGDEQALAATGRQEFEPVNDAGGAAGQNHDAVGAAVEHDLLARQ